MRAAPPVQWVCEPDRAWAAFVSTLGGLAAAVGVAWLTKRAGFPMPLLVAAAVLAAVLGAWVAGRGLVERAAHTLTWDGQGFTLDGQAADVVVRIDLNRWLLLRASTNARPCWLAWRTGGLSGPTISAVRAALYAQHREPRHA